MKVNMLQGRRPVFLLSKRRILTARIELWLLFLIVIGCVALQPALLRALQPQPNPATVSRGKVMTKDDLTASRTTRPVEGPAAQSTAAATPQSPTCARNTQYQSRPAGVELGKYDEGLTMINDAPAYYQIAGTTEQLRTMIRTCGPADDFAGETGYTLNWSYALSRDQSGLCRVVAIRVGIHTSMLLPSNISPSQSASWNSFVAALAKHETGHVAVADQYAADVLTQLRNYPGGDCYTMSPAVDALAQSIAAQLNTAQNQYDNATSHGATQGATL